MKKVFVEVIAKCDIDGKIFPLSVLWNDGRRFTVDRILDIRPAASLKAGGTGTRYLIRIGKNETHLFLESGRWFVEAK